MLDSVKKILFRLPAWFLTGITLFIIFWLTLSPKPFGELNPPLFPGADKIAHAIMFGFLVAMMAVDKLRKKASLPSNIFAHPLSPIYLFSCSLFSSLLGALIEYLQKWLDTGRTFESSDIIADCCGAFAATLIWLILQPKKSDSV